MAENQNIEYKESWRDEYLKWICGFANANGGKIYIGKNDVGEVVGLKDSKKLLEDIPNKTKDILGILVDVNLHQTEKGEFIEISVEAYPYPVNYKGQYHYRCGSTKQELKGAALDKFLLQRKGKRWDAVPIPNVSINDLKKETFDFFRKKAVKAQRIEEDVLTDSNELLIDNLQLNENEYLKRAAILLFHPNPDKFVSGAYIKIGYFEADDDLKFQDEVHGNLFEQIEKTIDLLFSKYIKSSISYEGLNRVEKYEYPKDAVREALLNAVSHKDYSGGVPIQISVYNDKLIFWNEGQLPENWTIEKLLDKHPSKPYNPDIANALFRSGYIESWGRGTLKIINECVQFGIPKPKYFYDMSGFWVEFRKDVFDMEYLKSLGLNERQIQAIKFVKENGKITNSEYQANYGVARNTATRDLSELVDKGILKSSETKGAGSYYEL
ncbi:MAG: transcriptional regulator [Bacteroidetes bacterium GWF2_42_66]|nr:MAG: transcriptional regulator [Bacteroidetes bacterium GWE2_42_39]OFY44878.1 MAG: transcriptional regulator [Bacteroidetes bacterium GWF2_42_66]HBL76006.1 transcriptional regulator [Prolixibacteraceae bacterium]HCU62122.1 transcriptional regulator [Prolixibacteraceae bacterium]